MELQQNISLKTYNTFGINVCACYFSSFQSTSQLEEISCEKIIKNKELLVLGGGSNILFVQDFNGLVLKNEIGGISVVKEDKDAVYIRAGAGVPWHQFVLYCIENDYAGVENLSLIPGNVGASPMQNIGAYGVEIKDVFYELEAFHINEKKLYYFSLHDCHFGYRESVFKKELRGQFIITSVTYRLLKKPKFNTSYGAINQELEKMGAKELSIAAISQAIINIRSSKLPDWKVIGNAGSFFKNPQVANERFKALKKDFPQMPSFPVDEKVTKIPAGWMIEQCGWKGYRKGDAGCYEKQALVLVNYGNALGKEIFNLSGEIILSVEQKFGIRLEREVNII